MDNWTFISVITIMIFHLPHSPVSLTWPIFSAVFSRLNEHRKTTPRPMTTVINIGDFRSLNMFLTSSPWCSCFASKSMVEFYRWSNKTKKGQISVWIKEKGKEAFYQLC